MKEIDENKKSFEDIKHIDKNGIEFWYAREIMQVLQYTKWQNFEKIIDKAKKACENSDISMFEHFTDVSKLSRRANNADVMIKDYKLTRYGSNYILLYKVKIAASHTCHYLYYFIIFKEVYK